MLYVVLYYSGLNFKENQLYKRNQVTYQYYSDFTWDWWLTKKWSYKIIWMAILWYRGITLSSVTWKIHLKKWSYTIPVPTYIGEKSSKRCMWQVPWWLIRGEDIYVHLSGGRRIMSTGFIIWELWCQKQVSRAWLSNYSPQDTVGCNSLAMP